MMTMTTAISVINPSAAPINNGFLDFPPLAASRSLRAPPCEAFASRLTGLISRLSVSST